MLSKEALQTIALVFSDNTLRLPPEMWRAGAEVQDWAAAQLKAEPGESPKG